jgi:hypothetical protein
MTSILSLNSKLMEPGSNEHARSAALTERFRCKCMHAPPSAPKRKQSQAGLDTWLGEKGEEKPDERERETCGGHVYISSEWDLRSHPAGVKGQRIVVRVVHPAPGSARA